MIALAPVPPSAAPRAPERTKETGSMQQRFLLLLPTIQRIARFAFRKLPGEQREDALQEVTASSYVAYYRLVARGKEDLAYGSPLARYAVAQYRAGRRIGCRMDSRDIMSPYCKQGLESLFSRVDGDDWEELAVEDRHATPAEVAATRIDFRAWLRRLDPHKRAAAKLLAGGATTSDAAKQLKLSLGRVSQLRRHLKETWEAFQGEEPSAAFVLDKFAQTR